MSWSETPKHCFILVFKLEQLNSDTRSHENSLIVTSWWFLVDQLKNFRKSFFFSLLFYQYWQMKEYIVNSWLYVPWKETTLFLDSQLLCLTLLDKVWRRAKLLKVSLLLHRGLLSRLKKKTQFASPLFVEWYAKMSEIGVLSDLTMTIDTRGFVKYSSVLVNDFFFFFSAIKALKFKI